jgi:hypothetical protein
MVLPIFQNRRLPPFKSVAVFQYNPLNFEALRGSIPTASEALLFVWIFSDWHKNEAAKIHTYSGRKVALLILVFVPRGETSGIHDIFSGILVFMVFFGILWHFLVLLVFFGIYGIFLVFFGIYGIFWYFLAFIVIGI